MHNWTVSGNKVASMDANNAKNLQIDPSRIAIDGDSADKLSIQMI
jgi:hypothetical protein